MTSRSGTSRSRAFRRNVLIAGASLAGPTLAYWLHRYGFDVTVVEKAHAPRGGGYPIDVRGTAIEVVRRMGILPRLQAAHIDTGRFTFLDADGAEVAVLRPSAVAGSVEGQDLEVARGDLTAALYETVRDDVELVFDDSVDTLDQHGHGVDVTFRSGRQRTFDVVIGADGIHSALRAQAYPDEGEPVWNGLILWRGTASVPTYLDGRTMIMAGDGEQKFVAYPLVAPGADEGATRLNFIAERRAPEGTSETADWNHPVDPAPIEALFADWRFDWLDVPAVIAASDRILEYPMVDRDALPRWSFGGSTLLGDAAHAMYPNGSNGASQAIIDARTLAFHLAGRATSLGDRPTAGSTARAVASALADYEADRRPATARLLAMTRQLGPEKVMQLAYDRAPQGFADVHDVIPAEELQQIADEYKRAAGFHPTALNERSSLTPTVSAGQGRVGD